MTDEEILEKVIKSEVGASFMAKSNDEYADLLSKNVKLYAPAYEELGVDIYDHIFLLITSFTTSLFFAHMTLMLSENKEASEEIIQGVIKSLRHIEKEALDEVTNPDS